MEIRLGGELMLCRLVGTLCQPDLMFFGGITTRNARDAAMPLLQGWPPPTRFFDWQNNAAQEKK